MDLNLFKLCSGLKFLGYLMILLVAAIIVVSYYAVVILTWGPHLLQGGFNSFLSFAIIAVFHFLVILPSPPFYFLFLPVYICSINTVRFHVYFFSQFALSDYLLLLPLSLGAAYYGFFFFSF